MLDLLLLSGNYINRRILMDIKTLCANTIRVISAEGVQKANSGHPGLPMGVADYVFILWSQFLNFNPEKPDWLNRDRFILSAGHGSMLLYTMLHLSGFDLSLDDLKSFRQWGSKTPGHPEYGDTPGVETTTGPLGQGFTNAVGMAIAEKMLQARLNKKEKIIDHYIYGIMSDGCVMEGISSEAASLAGHLKLDNMIFFYDDNQITIEGKTELAFSESVEEKYKALGWYVTKIDGHDFNQIERAIKECKQIREKPKMIIAYTIIGQGSPHQANTADVHGSPLGEDELKLVKENLGFSPDKEFFIPEEVREVFSNRVVELKKRYMLWTERFQSCLNDNEFKQEYESLKHVKVDDSLKQRLYDLFKDKDKIATRAASGEILQVLAEEIKCLVGGSADLAPSNKTLLKNSTSISSKDFSGRNLHFGVREHAMAGICNGIALYGFFIPYAATFLVFTDYARPSMRLAALMKLQVIYIMTHDSIFVGEDGPTHQPVEHYMALRAIPELFFFRPADAIETADTYITILKSFTNPSVIALTRQGLPVINRNIYSPSNVEKGAYILKKEALDKIDLIIIATGSEVYAGLKVAEKLESEGKSVRVVSMPCMKLFDMQNNEYKNSVLPEDVKNRVSLETGITRGWERYVGDKGMSIGIDRFGASAPAAVMAEKFGFTEEKIYQSIKEYLG